MTQPASTHVPLDRARAQPGEDHAIGLTTAALALLCSALWGGTVVAIRFSVDDLPPVGLAGMRFALAALFMLGWCQWEGCSLKIGAGQGIPIVVAATLLFVQISLLNLGIHLTSAAHGTLFINSHPVFVSVLAHFLLVGDRLTPRKLLGLSAAAAGIALVVYAGNAKTDAHDQPSLAGDLLVLASGLLLGMKIIYVKRALSIVEPGKLLFWHDVIGVALFLATSLLVEGIESYRFTTPAVVGLLYQGFVVAGFCFATWTLLLRRHRASQLAAFGFATPLFGLLMSNLLRGDRITPGLMVGGLAVAAGIYLASTTGWIVGED